MKKSVLLVIAAALALPAPAMAAANLQDGLNAMRELNLVTFGDRNGGSEVEGKAYIGGNLTGSIQVTQKTKGDDGHGYVAGDYADLTVGKNAETWSAGASVTGPGTLVQIGGNSTGSATMNLSGKPGHVDVGGTFNAGGFNPNPSKTVATGVPGLAASIQSTTDQLVANLTALSQTLNALPGTAITDMNSPLVLGSGDYSVFTMTAAQFNAQNVNFDKLFTNFTAGTDHTIIINVAGENLAESIDSLHNTAINEKVIWNFADATSISLNGWHGSILAPNAVLSNGSAIEGSIVTKVFNQGGEVHLGTYAGTDSFLTSPPPPAVPEPATWAMMLAGFGAVGSMIRRRRQERLAA